MKENVVRGLGFNIVFVTAWIEALPFHGLGNFDFISSTGVLYHLKCPERGLNVLNNIQSEDGGAIINVYGTYARNGIYQVQELMKLIYHKVPSIKKELNDAKVILSVLPKHHWFHTIKITDIIYYGGNAHMIFMPRSWKIQTLIFMIRIMLYFRMESPKVFCK